MSLKDRIVADAKEALLALDGIEEVSVHLAEMEAEERKRLFASYDRKGSVEHLNHIDRAIAVMRGKGAGGGRGAGGRGRGRMGGTKPGAGPGGYYACPNCGHKVLHQVGQPCYNVSCPRCGTRTVRE